MSLFECHATMHSNTIECYAFEWMHSDVFQWRHSITFDCIPIQWCAFEWMHSNECIPMNAFQWMHSNAFEWIGMQSNVMHWDAFECCAFERITHNAFECIRMLINRHSSASWGHVCHDSSICVPWLIHMCAMTHSYVCNDSSICVPWLIHMCAMTHSHVCHDSFICVPSWGDDHVCVMTLRVTLCVMWLTHDSYMSGWRGDVTYSRVTWRTHVWRDSPVCVRVCVTWLLPDTHLSWWKGDIHVCDLTHTQSQVMCDLTESSHTCDRVMSHVWKSWLCQVMCVDSVNRVKSQSQVMCDLTLSHVWFDRVKSHMTRQSLDRVKSCVTWQSQLCVSSHVWLDSASWRRVKSHVWLDSVKSCVTWLCHMCDLTLTCDRVKSHMTWQSRLDRVKSCVTWQSQVTHMTWLCVKTQSRVTHDLKESSDTSDRVKSHMTWLCDLTLLTESSHTYDLTLRVSVTWVTCWQSQVTHMTWLCVKTQSQVTHDLTHRVKSHTGLDSRHTECVTWLCVCDVVCDVTYSRHSCERMARWRDVFTCDMTRSCVCRCVCDLTYLCHTFESMMGWYLLCMCDMTHR